MSTPNLGSTDTTRRSGLKWSNDYVPVRKIKPDPLVDAKKRLGPTSPPSTVTASPNKSPSVRNPSSQMEGISFGKTPPGIDCSEKIPKNPEKSASRPASLSWTATSPDSSQSDRLQLPPEDACTANEKPTFVPEERVRPKSLNAYANVMEIAENFADRLTDEKTTAFAEESRCFFEATLDATSQENWRNDEHFKDRTKAFLRLFVVQLYRFDGTINQLVEDCNAKNLEGDKKIFCKFVETNRAVLEDDASGTKKFVRRYLKEPHPARTFIDNFAKSIHCYAARLGTVPDDCEMDYRCALTGTPLRSGKAFVYVTLLTKRQNGTIVCSCYGLNTEEIAVRALFPALSKWQPDETRTESGVCDKKMKIVVDEDFLLHLTKSLNGIVTKTFSEFAVAFSKSLSDALESHRER